MRSWSVGCVVGAVLALAAVRPATADEGRREINQACALVGCFSGDTPDFPVRIDTPGGYVLTGDLTVTDANTPGILVESSAFVTIDLNGFEIAGPVNCTGAGSALTCGAGAGSGIVGLNQVAVLNGRVRGFGGRGVWGGLRSRIEGVNAEANGGIGIVTGPLSIVRHCIAQQNADVGIRVDANSIVEDSTAADNRARGIHTTTTGIGIVVTRSTAFRNGIDGIAGGFGALIQGNNAYLNEAAGIAAAQGSTVIDNTAYDNNGNGIYAIEDGSTISRNTLRNNGGYGLFLVPGTSTYRDNTITSNAAGTVSGGVNMGANSCNGNPTCP